MTRRTFCVSVTAAATGMLGGCAERTSYRLRVRNTTVEAYELDVTVSNVARDQVVFERTFNSWDDGPIVVEDVFDIEDDYLVRATVEDHTDEYYFDPGKDGISPVASLQVDIYDGGRLRIFLSEP
ncbi:hypothetical protein [Haloferax sp. DFSO60]|uniref:hypothetical protein n=1 Tax=Haloferax sp. DFSO60 TaxID=3388652 RepID=UPI0039786267